VGLATYFISYAQGVDYFVKGIPWGLAGLAPAILFFLFYLIGGRIFRPKSNLLSMLACSAFGCGIFFLTGYLLRKVALNLWGALLIFVAVYLLNIFIVGKLRVEDAGESAPKKRLPSRYPVGGLSRGHVSNLTGVASLAGSEWQAF
jgi:predicted permease